MKKRILLEYSKEKFDILSRAKAKTGLKWNELVLVSVLNYASIRPGMAFFNKAIEFEDGYMKVDLARVLVETLDIENYYIVWKRDKNTKKRVPIERWKILRVQSVLSAFAYHLATANELRWFWDQTGNHLAEYLEEALRDIGLEWKDIKNVVEMIITTIWSLYPWLWGKELAVNVGRKVVQELSMKYPELEMRRARRDEDTVEERRLYANLTAMHYARTGQFVTYMPRLCIEGVSVVVEWSDEKGEHSYCFSFVD